MDPTLGPLPGPLPLQDQVRGQQMAAGLSQAVADAAGTYSFWQDQTGQRLQNAIAEAANVQEQYQGKMVVPILDGLDAARDNYQRAVQTMTAPIGAQIAGSTALAQNYLAQARQAGAALPANLPPAIIGPPSVGGISPAPAGTAPPPDASCGDEGVRQFAFDVDDAGGGVLSRLPDLPQANAAHQLGNLLADQTGTTQAQGVADATAFISAFGWDNLRSLAPADYWLTLGMFLCKEQALYGEPQARCAPCLPAAGGGDGGGGGGGDTSRISPPFGFIPPVVTPPGGGGGGGGKGTGGACANGPNQQSTRVPTVADCQAWLVSSFVDGRPRRMDSYPLVTPGPYKQAFVAAVFADLCGMNPMNATYAADFAIAGSDAQLAAIATLPDDQKASALQAVVNQYCCAGTPPNPTPPPAGTPPAPGACPPTCPPTCPPEICQTWNVPAWMQSPCYPPWESALSAWLGPDLGSLLAKQSAAQLADQVAALMTDPNPPPTIPPTVPPNGRSLH